MTGRLIEADKLRAWFEAHSVWDEFSVGYIMGLIDEQPTVEAIPVEFIQKTISEAQEADWWDCAHHLDFLITHWRAEGEEE